MPIDFQQSWLKDSCARGKKLFCLTFPPEKTLKEVTLNGEFTPIDDDVNRKKLQGNLH